MEELQNHYQELTLKECSFYPEISPISTSMFQQPESHITKPDSFYLYSKKAKEKANNELVQVSIKSILSRKMKNSSRKN